MPYLILVLFSVLSFQFTYATEIKNNSTKEFIMVNLSEVNIQEYKHTWINCDIAAKTFFKADEISYKSGKYVIHSQHNGTIEQRCGFHHFVTNGYNFYKLEELVNGPTDPNPPSNPFSERDRNN